MLLYLINCKNKFQAIESNVNTVELTQRKILGRRAVHEELEWTRLSIEGSPVPGRPWFGKWFQLLWSSVVPPSLPQGSDWDIQVECLEPPQPQLFHFFKKIMNIQMNVISWVFTFQSPAMQFVGEIRFHFVICKSNLFNSFKIKIHFKFN